MKALTDGNKIIGPTAQRIAMKRFEVRYSEAEARHQHLWLVLIALYAEPGATEQMVSAETFAYSPPPGCFICEEDYSEELAAKPCTGDPDGRTPRL